VDGLAFAVALHTRCTPAAAGQMAIVDALSLVEALRERETAEAKFQAALHGRELR